MVPLAFLPLVVGKAFAQSALVCDSEIDIGVDIGLIVLGSDIVLDLIVFGFDFLAIAPPEAGKDIGKIADGVARAVGYVLGVTFLAQLATVLIVGTVGIVIAGTAENSTCLLLQLLHVRCCKNELAT